MVGGEQRDRMKIGRQRADFLDLCRRAGQQKLILMIESPQRANHIADICAYAKLGHPPNIDGDLHGWHLTTESTEEHRGIMLAPRLVPLPFARSRAGMPRTARVPACGPCSARLRQSDAAGRER